jgi:signal transduction histidine kinase
MSTDAAAHLRILRPAFVERSAARLARAEGLRAMAAEQITRFFLLLEDSVESNSPEWLDSCLQDWVNARSRSAFGERLTLLPVLDNLKAVTWEVVRDSCSAQEALDILVAVELSYVHAQSFVAVLEVDALLRETVTRLQETQENMRRLEKSKADFIAIAAHELKTPLTLIEGYADMLTEEVKHGGGSGTIFLISGITKGILRLREIVEDMIDVSMIDNNVLSLSFQPVRLLRVVRRIAGELDPALQDRQLTLTIDPEGAEDDAIIGDPQRLLQVFRQVILNAVKFTPDGGRISVAARRRPGFVEVKVTDSGIGIAFENQQRIFEKFGSVADVALHSTSKTKFKGGGAGLGLAIAKGIVEAHGGTIWCESPGYNERLCPGSTFHIMLPITPLASEAETFAEALKDNSQL